MYEPGAIAAVGHAFPKHCYSQKEIADALGKRWADKLPRPEVFGRLLGNMGVSSRYLALPIEAYDTLDTWGKANDAWIENAVELGQQAICGAVTRAGLTVRDVDAIFVVSVTGIASPSVDARLVNRMHLRNDIKRLPIFGLGCVAGAAGVARAADYVRAFPDHVAVLLAVELCSLTWQRDDLSVANLISSGLFGDGAAAVVITGSERRRNTNGPRILDSRSSFYPDTESVMGWDISEQGFRIVLSPDVPKVVYEHLADDVDGFLASHDLKRSDIGAWVMHTGGPKVLESTVASLDLPSGALDASWECLDRAGNLSSASVLLVLEEFVNARRPDPGTLGLLAAMGPGFCSELVLLEW
ncbi:MAG TPA: 3-oxoacyl-[acyl-carrier-protein] synthase III C-terminal domain-containing protein [Thermoanaerobaculia bacterium]|jgi:alkylresorcinol/alkylpyrone synthase|nr:3-oxoacyl-[acyl-carrier-protein] synthase III C-terminal domain-containing protein [Thermoanaerobaculia bacterium]